MAKTDPLEDLIREFAQKLRAHFTSEVDARLQEAQAEFAKAAQIFAQLGAGPASKAARWLVKAAAPGKRVRRSPEQLQEQAKAVLSAVRKNPGSRIDKLVAATGLPSPSSKVPSPSSLQARR